MRGSWRRCWSAGCWPPAPELPHRPPRHPPGSARRRRGRWTGARGVPGLQPEVTTGYGGFSGDEFSGANRPDVVVLSDTAVRLQSSRAGLPPDVPVVVLAGDESYRIGNASVLSLPPVVDHAAGELAAALR